MALLRFFSKKPKNAIVISLGGSLLIPEGIDTQFIFSFREMITNYTFKGYSFFIIVGGGRVCRLYQNASKELGVVSLDSLDWVGIHATRLNAEFIRIIFGDVADSKIVTNPYRIPYIHKPVVIGAGWKPGWSSDYDAVTIAEQIGAKKIINLTNIDYVFSDDPRKNPEAQIIKDINWTDFRKIIPAEWHPGVNAPFDPVASKKADELALTVAIMNGKNIENIKEYIEGREFIGSIIHP
jgi:uridylate kinase